MKKWQKSNGFLGLKRQKRTLTFLRVLRTLVQYSPFRMKRSRMDLLELTRRLIAIESVTGNEADIVRFLRDYLEAAGLAVTLQPVADGPVRGFRRAVPGSVDPSRYSRAFHRPDGGSEHSLRPGRL
jgi:hypothetical protein